MYHFSIQSVSLHYLPYSFIIITSILIFNGDTLNPTPKKLIISTQRKNTVPFNPMFKLCQCFFSITCSPKV